MRAPDDDPPGKAPHRAGKKFESDLSLRYLSPGAFTVLPPDETPPNPPPPPPAHRLTPATRRSRNQAFSILAEPTSNPGSRSPSPTGRVSPFRGRGFNPTGSRHASPAPSPPPPPDDCRNSRNTSPRRSQIPQLNRRVSASIFGEKVTHETSPKFKRKSSKRLSPQLSKSLPSIEPKKVSYKPPPSPRRHGIFSKTPAFQRLSPISGSGSSPEPTADQPKSKSSSPSRIPQRSRSQPPSRQTSPSRKPQAYVNKPVSRNNSRPTSKNTSRNVSREPSPNKLPTSPTRAKNYKNVQAKVNSFSKPKVPPRPEVVNKKDNTKNSEKSTREISYNKNNRNVGKITGTNKSNNNDSSNKTDSVSYSVNNAKNTGASEKNKDNKNSTKPENSKSKENAPSSKLNNKNSKSDNSNLKKSNSKDNFIKSAQDLVKLSDMLQPSATAVVSSTTTTVTQPLKIEAKIEPPVKCDSNNEKITPMVDGRILSATSVSNAINKMNDTVLNTQTLMKDPTFSRLSPAASAIISMSNVNNRPPKPEYKSMTKITPNDDVLGKTANTTVLKDGTSLSLKVEGADPPKTSTIINTSNHVIESKTLGGSDNKTQITVNNNVTKSILSDQKTVGINVTTNSNNNALQKSANDRIREARTVVASDVKPIKILVKEKPSDAEVQSGNVRIPVSSTNGINERPGLPPPQPQQIEQAECEDKPKNACARLLTSCRKKMSCKRKKTDNNDDVEAKSGCFSCNKKAKIEENILPTNKSSFFERIKCCKKNKVSDTGCCPRGKRKDSWIERRDSILSEPQPQRSRCSKLACKNALRKMFCLNACRKKKAEENDSRRTSLSKKKSLTPTAPPEEPKRKLDMSLVEHTSHMKGAIPVLPVPLAWFCLIFNIFLPGTGTIFSGLFCLCLGKPRFSQKDGPRPRIGAFLIDLIIGCGQLFTVLFCLVGWGWSIWWGIIMLKIAKKNKRIRLAEKMNEEHQQSVPVVNQNHHPRDVERGS